MPLPRRTVLQPGQGSACDLFVYCHIDPTIIAKKVAEVTTDAVVVEFWGSGTSAYKPLIPAYGGNWRSYVAGLEQRLGKSLARSCLTTWSAGSQVVKDVCLSDPAHQPEAIVMLDGLYGSKPPGSKQGDGEVIFDAALEAIAKYALRAARGECIMVLFHSRIPTPYASSKECCDAIKGYVEKELGEALWTDTSLTAAQLDGHDFVEALAYNNFHLVEFKGMDAAEHITEAHLYDEVWWMWVPFAQDVNPAPAPVWTGDDLPSMALALSLGEEAAHVGETPPGSNKVKPAYWAGATRIVGGKEALVKVTIGPWCAAAFQWATYEAALRLGLINGDPNTAWLAGPVPHGRRISVAELEHDFKQRGMFKTKTEVLAGDYDPQPGDGVLLDRAVPGATGLGHACRFVRRIDKDTFESVGGNESGDGKDKDVGDRWRKTVRRYDELRLRGFGAFPRQAGEAKALAPEDIKELNALVYDSIDQSMRAYLDRPRDGLGT